MMFRLVDDVVECEDFLPNLGLITRLMLSVAKWEFVVRAVTENPTNLIIDGAVATCALCDAFHPMGSNHSGDGECRGCPIKEYTGMATCVGTPYETWEKTGSLLAAEAELGFLQMLLKNHVEKVPSAERSE